MGKVLAFTVSLGDMIRKLGYRYERPIDYLGSFVSALYAPGREVDIRLSDHAITLTSPGSLDEGFLDDIVNKKILALCDVIPPIKEYRSVTIQSGTRMIVIDENRNIEQYESPREVGVEITIQRDELEVEPETERIQRLYIGSDLEMRLGGEQLSRQPPGSFHFDQDGFVGQIDYNPLTNGGVCYFAQGRFVTHEPNVRGVNINLHQHELQATITKSNIIKSGKGKKAYEAWKKALPNILLSFLQSEEVTTLRDGSELAYQTLLRSVMREYRGDPVLHDHLIDNLRFSDNKGRIRKRYTAAYVEAHPELFGGSPEGELLGTRTEVYRPPEPSRYSPIVRGIAAASLLLLIGVGAASFLSNVVGGGLQGPCSGSSCAVDRGALPPPSQDPLVEAIRGGNEGARYGTNSELSGLLNMLMKAAAEKRKLSHLFSNPYVRKGTNNVLTCSKNAMNWTTGEPLEQLVVKDCVADMGGIFAYPNRLREKDLEEKIDIVSRVLRGFTYGTVHPKQAQFYKDILEATLVERRAICNSANSSAAVLFNMAGVHNVRAAYGTYIGVPHMWLEINEGTQEDPDWEVYDFTPARVDKEVLADLNIDLSFIKAFQSLYGLVVNRNNNQTSFDHIQNEGQVMIGNPVMYANMAASQLISFAVMGLLLAGGIALVSGSVAVARDRQARFRAGNNIEFNGGENPYATECYAVQDLLRVKRVEPTESDAFSYSPDRNVLSVPVGYLRARSPVDIALKAIPQMGLSDQAALARYERIVDIVRS